MAAIDRSPFATAARRPSIAARTAEFARNAYKIWKNRRAIYHLGDMSDTELADIGLRRADLRVAFQAPFGTDPTEQLGFIAQARAASALARRE